MKKTIEIETDNKFDIVVVNRGKFSTITRTVVKERSLTIILNNIRLVTLQCTPLNLPSMLVGFLFFEGLIKNVNDIESIQVCKDAKEAEIILKNKNISDPQIYSGIAVRTSGCGSGFVFKDIATGADCPKIESGFMISWKILSSCFLEMYQNANLYKNLGGIHTSALFDSKGNLKSLQEDIGRHNTLDKLAGEVLFYGWQGKEMMILTTGRLSAEMVYKACKIGIPVVASRTSPTDAALALAEKTRMTVAGYVKKDSMRIYTYPERISQEN